MAEQKLLIELKWENGVGFVMSSKLGTGPEIEVVSMMEDAETSTVWSGIQSACIAYMQKKLSDIGRDMMV